MRDTLTLVLAGGEGRRLLPLTRERSKPAVHFGGRYRRAAPTRAFTRCWAADVRSPSRRRAK